MDYTEKKAKLQDFIADLLQLSIKHNIWFDTNNTDAPCQLMTGDDELLTEELTLEDRNGLHYVALLEPEEISVKVKKDDVPSKQ